MGWREDGFGVVYFDVHGWLGSVETECGERFIAFGVCEREEKIAEEERREVSG